MKKNLHKNMHDYILLALLGIMISLAGCAVLWLGEDITSIPAWIMFIVSCAWMFTFGYANGGTK